jgi:hypothetical protein
VLDPALPAATQRVTMQKLGDEAVRELAQRYARAWESGDVSAIVSLLTEDARYSMPPVATWFAGRAAIRGFLLAGPLTSRWRFLPTSANGQVAFGTYRWDEERAAYLPGGLDVLTLRDQAIGEVVSFLDADLGVFGLPSYLPG